MARPGMAERAQCTRGGVGDEPTHPLSLVLQQVERGQRAGDGGRRKRGGEDNRAGRIHEVARHLEIAGDKATVRSQRRAQRPDDHVDVILQARAGQRTAPAGSERADPVSVVDHGPHPVVVVCAADGIHEHGRGLLETKLCRRIRRC